MAKQTSQRWARRVAPHTIRQLFAADARGIVDKEAVLDEMALAN